MKSKGVIAINKPKDWTSFDVVNKIKYKVKPLKVGHLGTLDPMATGVLLVTIGQATKLFDLMQEKQKTYVATFEFGYLTDTLDSMGKIIEKSDKLPTINEIQAVLPNFIGEISQIPPKYSAKSVNGQRAYNLARKGVEFELKPKLVTISSINVLSYQNGLLKLEICCGSGTYIRSIGRDIAEKLNTFATMTELVRTKVGNIELKDCLEMENLENIQNCIIQIKDICNHETLNLDKKAMFKLLNGQIIEIEKPDGVYMLQDAYDTVAIVKIENNKAKMSIFLG